MTGDAAPKPWVRRDATPFEPENRVAVRHGARSPGVIAAEAERVRGELAERFEILGDPMFAGAFERCCQAQALANMLSDYIWGVIEGTAEAYHPDPRHPRTGVMGVPQHLLTEYNRAQQNAQKFAQDCGLDPIGFAKLVKELGWAKHLAGSGGVQSLVQRGRELQAGRAERTGSG